MSRLPSPYRTNLDFGDELGYQQFLIKNNLRDDNRFNSTYDMRGYYKKFGSGGGETEMMPDGMHFTDEFKTPFHPTYSTESKYKFPRLKRSWHMNSDNKTYSLIDDNSGEVIRDERNIFAFPGLMRG